MHAGGVVRVVGGEDLVDAVGELVGAGDTGQEREQESGQGL